MRLESFLWLEEIIEKLAVKHGVEPWEVEELFANSPRIRFRQKGNRQGEDVYTALGRTDAGRYLFVVFIHKPRTQDRPSSHALVVSARDMEQKERKEYDRD